MANAKRSYENALKDHEALVKKIDNDIKNYQKAMEIAKTALADTISTQDQTIINNKEN